MPERPDPNDMSPMMRDAIAIHEIFRNYVAAGFDEDQALRLLAHQLHLKTPDPPRG